MTSYPLCVRTGAVVTPTSTCKGVGADIIDTCSVPMEGQCGSSAPVVLPSEFSIFIQWWFFDSINLSVRLTTLIFCWLECTPASATFCSCSTRCCFSTAVSAAAI